MSLIRNSLILRSVTSNLRNYSASAPLVNVAVNEKTGIATATLQRLPVNSLNVELLTEFNAVLDSLEKNKSRGLILTSAGKSVFSAGIDITEMYKPNLDRVTLFWSTLQQMWIKLYGSSYPTVAVINGHSPAGGCLLAMSCEYRVMLNNFTIGLNETQLGIVAPDWFVATMRNTIGRRQSELALTTGKLFKTEEALSIGLVDEAVDSKEEGLQRAEAFFQRFAKIPPLARSYCKKSLRKNEIQALVKNQKEDLEHFTTFVQDERIQKGLGMYLESLKQRQK